MEVIWTDRAAANLDFFKEQIRKESGVDDVAERFYAKVILRAGKLESTPNWIGVPVKEYPGAGYMSLYVMDYRIIYRVSNANVYIVAFVHKSMLIDGMLG
jgi:mRNA-degrading endonuclease RelE of RelBE toxin-antitoxin system